MGFGAAPINVQLASQGINPYGGATIDQSAFQKWQAQQAALANTLQTQAKGGGPSAAGAMLAAGSNAAASNALSQANAGSRYGTNAAAGAYAANANAANAESGAANQATQLRATEQEAAQQGLAGLTGTAAGQAGQMAQGQAGLTEQANLTNEQIAANAFTKQTDNASQSQQKLLGTVGGVISGGASSGATGMMARGSLVTRPVKTTLGEKGPEIVIPLKKNAAPYHPGKIPSKMTPHPAMREMPPINPRAVKPSAMARLAGQMPPAPRQPGSMPLSPGVAGIARAYMAKRPPPSMAIHAGR
jgi:hypothetical protein